MNSRFLQGMRHGIPIMLGYLSVSFGFGILAVQLGLSIFTATAISATNLTSAGQAMGVQVMTAGDAFGSTIIQMVLTQLIINVRYSLMGISLSQKLDSSFTTPHRLIASFGITDEIFAVASSQSFAVTPAYMYGLILVSMIGWISGTFLGASAGQLLPTAVTNAMGILLYGMFLAIIIPPARKNYRVLWVILMASAISVLFSFCIPAVPSGFAVIISATVASAVCAWLFPLEQEMEAQS